MSLEPEKPIEKLLRASAKNRRDQAGAGFELPAVNRKLLQQEVERKFAQSRRPPSRNLLWLIGLRWRAALTGLTSLLVIGVVLWLAVAGVAPKRNVSLLAKNDEFSKSKSLDAEVNQKTSERELVSTEELARREVPDFDKLAASSKKETTELKRDAAKDVQLALEPANERSRGLVDQTSDVANRPATPALSAAAPSPTSPPQEAPSAGFASRYGFAGGLPAKSSAAPKPQTLADEGTLLDKRKLIVSSSSAPAVSTTSVENSSTNRLVQYGYFAATQTPNNQQRSFQQLNEKRAQVSAVPLGAAIGGPVPGQVLTYFRVEQSNAGLRVIDSDDSVYAGEIQPNSVPNKSQVNQQQTAASANLRNALRQNQNAASLASRVDQQTDEPPGYVFQVIGTNRTSNQRVVFSGLLTGPSNLTGNFTDAGAAARNSVGQSTLPAGRQVNKSQANLQSQNLHVTGTVLLGAEQLDIDAVPAPPPQSAPR